MQMACVVAEEHTPLTEWAGSRFEADRTNACAGEEAAGSNASLVAAASSLRRNLPSRELSLPLLLQISDDENLAQSRRGLICMAGYEVQTCGSMKASYLDEAQTLQFAAAVFCQSVHPNIAVSLSQLLCFWNPGIRLVRFSKRPWQEKEPEAYHLLLQAPLPPHQFVSTMLSLRSQA